MFRKASFAALAAFAVGVSGCGDAGDTPLAQPSDSAEPDPDLAVIIPDPLPDSPVAEDLSSGDAGETWEALPDVGADSTDTEVKEDCPGDTFCPCIGNADCWSGFCVDTMEGMRCSKPCTDETSCPKGWRCSLVGGGTDKAYACVAPPKLCQPCKADGECAWSAGTDACIDRGTEGRFCGVSCETDASCPDHPVPFICVAVPGDRGMIMQCIPADGVCPCTEKFSDKKFVTDCSWTNDVGTCTAERTCDQACPAPEPTAEICNGQDDDCDGVIDNDVGPSNCERTNEFGTCAGQADCVGGKPGLCQAGEPAAESCNGVDDDCDGDTDEEDAKGCTAFLLDADGDSFGAVGDEEEVNRCLCAAAAPFAAAVGGDCDDASAETHPGASEACNGRDDDCDGETEEEDAVGCSLWYLDQDSDGYGIGAGVCLCQANGHYTALAAGDCDDGNAAASPDATEVCNGLDDNCDGFADPDEVPGCTQYFIDADHDGHGAQGTKARCLCAPDAVSTYASALSDDCDDTNLAIHPGAEEVCDGEDNDCDGGTDGEGISGCEPTGVDFDSDGACDGERCLCPTSTRGEDPWCTPDDNCPFAWNPAQEDMDGDGIGDACDCDVDDDGVANAGKAVDGSDCPACEHEGEPACDNCPSAFNPDQADADLNGIGDACDCDADGDGDGNCDGPDTDCAPLDPSIHHGAQEVCNGIDDNCNGLVDEEGAVGCKTAYYDEDGDGWGTDKTKCLCFFVGFYRADRQGDCDDRKKDVNPDATEVCGGGTDEDCDGLTDEEGAAGCILHFRDQDGDGYGVTEDSRCLCAAAAPYTAIAGGDCDDADPGRHPGATEFCNGYDADCDGLANEEGALGCNEFGYDADGDGWWDADTPKRCLCAAAGFYRGTKGADCDDGDAAVSPGAPELCGNGSDDDCDGLTDEPGATDCQQYWRDVDGDGYGNDNKPQKCLCGPDADTDYTATKGGDCNDSDSAAHPGATEVCNLKDDDCDGAIDEPGALGCTTWYRDEDSDGYGILADSICSCVKATPYTAAAAGECDDAEPGVHPGALEVCANGRDDDCDGQKDEPGCLGCVDHYLDADNDGWGVTGVKQCLSGPAGDYRSTRGGDCNDTDPTVHPGATEECNGKDDDCDGTTDPEDAAGCVTYFKDSDADGWGLSGDSRCLCSPKSPHAATKLGDCDDANPAAFPGNPERCSTAFDDDCDGETNEDDAQGCSQYFRDLDRDGWGNSAAAACHCAPATPWDATKGGDCNDADADVSPGATEKCNGKDDDCDGTPDPESATGCVAYYEDADSDGYGKTTVSKCLCGPAGLFSTTVAGDCDDANALANPRKEEDCATAFDDDCDGKIGNCDDGDPCTDDACDAALGCSHVRNSQVIAGPSVLTDCATGYKWMRESPPYDFNWASAKAWCEDLTLEGTGWKLPSSNQLLRLCALRSYFVGTFDYFWTTDQPPVPTLGVYAEMGICKATEADKSWLLHVKCFR